MIPQAGMSGVATLAHMVVVEVLVNIGIKFDADLVADILSGLDAMGNIITQNTAGTVMISNDSMKMSPVVYISCNKGNKKSNKNLNKYMC